MPRSQPSRRGGRLRARYFRRRQRRIGSSLRIASAFGATDCSAGSALLLPDGASEVVAMARDVFGGAGQHRFDANGRAALATVSVKNLSATLDIRVEAETGYVY